VKKILHIGFPKCASTTIQENIFNKMEKFLYFGATLNNNGKYEEISISLIKAIRSKDDNLIQKYLKLINKIHLDNPTKTVVISNEAFIYDLDFNIYNNFFKEYEILVFIRSPVDFLISKYRQYLRGFGTKFDKLISFTEYLTLLEQKEINEYKNLINLNNNLSKRLNIFHFENIISDKKNFFNDFGNFLDIPIDVILETMKKYDSNPGLSEIDFIYFKIQTFPIIGKLIKSSILSKFRKIIKIYLPNKKKKFTISNGEKNRINFLFKSYYEKLSNL